MIILRFLLFPFSLLYAFIAGIRNWLFNVGIFKSVNFAVSVISIGNLRVGGTGKTPHVEFLIKKLKDKFEIATISRGYGRETRGFLLASEELSARDLGDEPLQIYKKFQNEITVSVCEDRALAIPRLMSEKESISLILLDDAFQHRYVKPKINILLTTYDKPFYYDFILPTGMLRESHYGARRADLIIVTKCPQDISEDKKTRIKKKIQVFAKNDTAIYFSSFKYQEPVSFDGGTEICPVEVVLVSGLANESPFIDYVKKHYKVVEEKHFADHYDYYSDDLELFKEWLDKHPDAALLCSEKDFVKLNEKRFREMLSTKKRFYVPIEVEILDNENEFIQEIITRIS